MVAFNFESNENDIPPKHILDWCRELVRVATDGAVWGIPRSATVFQIDKQNKRLICLSLGPENDDSDFVATKKVFKHIGWEVVMAKETSPGAEQSNDA